MYLSIRNALLVKALLLGSLESVQLDSSGGEVRFTSFCNRHWYASPFWSTWVVWAVSARERPLTRLPLTFPHRPYRLSKLWFSWKITTTCLY